MNPKRGFLLSAGQALKTVYHAMAYSKSSHNFNKSGQNLPKSTQDLPHQVNGSPKSIKHKISRSSVKCEILGDDDSIAPGMLDTHVIIIL